MSELSPDARALIEGARGSDDPTQAERERMRASLSLTLGAAAFAGAQLPSLAAAGAGAGTGTELGAKAGAGMLRAWLGKSLALKLTAAGLTAATVTTLSVAWRESERAAKPQAAQLMAAVSKHEPARPSQQAVLPVPAQPERLLEAEPPVAATRLAHGPRARAFKASPRVAGQPATTDRPPEQAAQAGEATDITQEMRYLATAQAALAHHDTAAVLRALDAHEKRFPNGALRPERLGTSAIALCQAGRTNEGLAQVARLVEAAPGSPLLTRARAACSHR